MFYVVELSKNKKSLAKILILTFIVPILAVLILSIVLSQSSPLEKYNVALEIDKSSMTHKSLYITIQNLQDTPENLNIKTILNSTDFDTTQVSNVKSYVWDIVTYFKTIPTYTNESYNYSWYDNETNQTIEEIRYRLVQNGTKQAEKQKYDWVEKQLISSTFGDTNKGIKHQWEQIPIDKAGQQKDTLKFKLDFDHPIIRKSDGWGSQGILWLDVNGKEYVDLTSSSWWNDSWSKCRSITITEKVGQNRTLEPIEVNLTNLTVLSARKEIRIINQSCNGGGSEIPVQIMEERNGTAGSDWAFVIFQANVTRTSTTDNVTTYSVYYNNSNATQPSYIPDPYFTIENSSKTLRNKWIKLEGDTSINNYANFDDLHYAVAGDGNYNTTDVLEAYAPENNEGIFTYTRTGGDNIYSSTTAGSWYTILDSSLKKIIRVDYGSMSFTVTMYAGRPYFLFNYSAYLSTTTTYLQWILWTQSNKSFLNEQYYYNETYYGLANGDFVPKSWWDNKTRSKGFFEDSGNSPFMISYFEVWSSAPNHSTYNDLVSGVSADLNRASLWTGYTFNIWGGAGNTSFGAGNYNFTLLYYLGNNQNNQTIKNEADKARNPLVWSLGAEESGIADEADGRIAIVNGIIDSLGSGVPIYTNQQIYTRNLTNGQENGTFDKVTSNNTKRWAFNYVTTGESFTNMHNLSTTLYVLELTNKTSVDIRNLVSDFINNTK